MKNKFCLIKTTFDTEEEAVSLAEMLLHNNLIVSAQIKEMRSLYTWNDEYCDEHEFELTCFTESRLYPEVEKFINSNHSYELCELICIPLLNISDRFGNWISSYTGKEKEDGCKSKNKSNM